MGLVLFSTFNNDLKGGKHIKITDYPKLTGGVNTNEGKQKEYKEFRTEMRFHQGEKKKERSHICASILNQQWKLF